MTFALYANINVLEPVSFIAGTEYIFTYTVYENDGISPVDISAATVFLSVCPYGRPDYESIYKAGVLTGNPGEFTVTLEYDDTKSLQGKFIQQPVLIDFFAKQYRLGQGEILILPRITS